MAIEAGLFIVLMTMVIAIGVFAYVHGDMSGYPEEHYHYEGKRLYDD